MMDMSGMMMFIALGWFVVHRGDRRKHLVARKPNSERARDSALAILRERYARGEISKEEYESRRRDLAA